MHIRFIANETKVDFGEDNADIFARQSLIWYNPGSFEMLEDELLEFTGADSQAAFEARQFKAVLEYFEFWLPNNCNMIDPPQTQRCLSNKPIQLQSIAKALPSHLIETELISKPDQLTAGILVKHLGESRRIGNDEAFYAQELHNDQLSALHNGPWTPLLAQQPVSATEEFRTFAFGRESATIRIPRPVSSDRIYDIQFFPDHVARALPVSPTVSNDLWGSLAEAIGLSVFAVDYVMQGSIPKIFEINPVFSWSWLPDACIDAIADAARAYLAGPWASPDLASFLCRGIFRGAC
jgi:hypothetical protein